MCSSVTLHSQISFNIIVKIAAAPLFQGSITARNIEAYEPRYFEDSRLVGTFEGIVVQKHPSFAPQLCRDKLVELGRETLGR